MRLVPKRRGQVGAPPGTVAAAPDAQATTVNVFGYSRDGFIERTIDNVADIRPLLTKWTVTWVNVEGLVDVERLKRLAEMFGIHPLALEDIVHVHQRPKVEPYGETLFAVVRMPFADGHLESEQLSLVLGRNFVVTFQDRPGGDCLDPIRERIRHAYGRVRNAGADYLCYALIDAVIDHYFPIVERYGDRLEAIDESGSTMAHDQVVALIQEIRHDLLVLRRAAAPLRDAVAALRADDSGLITEETKLYIRDGYDHVTHLVETVQSYQDMSAWHMESALSSLNFRSGEIMRVLTLIATIFMPLSFIAGVYGMNFHTEKSPFNMPELSWYFGYPFALTIMGATAAGLLFYFRRRNWI